MTFRFSTLIWAALMTLAATAAASTPLTPERVFASPALSGPAARGVAVSPDGRWVTWLKAEPNNQFKLDLWAAPVAGGEGRLLVSGEAVEPAGQANHRPAAEKAEYQVAQATDGQNHRHRLTRQPVAQCADCI